jgi:hypothetical protein
MLYGWGIVYTFGIPVGTFSLLYILKHMLTLEQLGKYEEKIPHNFPGFLRIYSATNNICKKSLGARHVAQWLSVSWHAQGSGFDPQYNQKEKKKDRKKEKKETKQS